MDDSAQKPTRPHLRLQSQRPLCALERFLILAERLVELPRQLDPREGILRFQFNFLAEQIQIKLSLAIILLLSAEISGVMHAKRRATDPKPRRENLRGDSLVDASGVGDRRMP